jgi:hypothetical protein
MGGVGSGPRPGDRLGAIYMTANRRRQIAIWEAEHARLKEERHQAALERQRIRNNERSKNRSKEQRAANREARAAGLPLPYPNIWRPHKPEPARASTPRWRHFIERQRTLLSAWTEAIAEDKKRTRRLAKGLPPLPKTHAQRQADYLKRKAAERAERLAASWFSPELGETSARERIRQTHPSLDEMTVHVEYGCLVQQCKMWRLNVNNFTIAQIGEDGITKANLARAIFDTIQTRTNNPDYVSVLKSADFVTDFAGLVGDVNAQNKAIIRAGERWGTGSAILKAVQGKRESRV